MLSYFVTKNWYLPLKLQGPGGAYKQKSRIRREWIGLSKGMFFQQFSLQWNFFPSMSKIYRKNIFTRISYKKTKQKENFGKLVWSLSYYIKYSAAYYVPLKKSGCALSPERSLGNLSPRYCQQTVSLARSRLNFAQFKPF